MSSNDILTGDTWGRRGAGVWGHRGFRAINRYDCCSTAGMDDEDSTAGAATSCCFASLSNRTFVHDVNAATSSDFGSAHAAQRIFLFASTR